MHKNKGWELEEDDLDVMDYPFDEADSDQNITYADPKDPNEQASPDDPPQIKSATLTKLVEKLTSSDNLDMNYISDFLLTFRSFTTSNELLTLLIKRFNIPPPKSTKEEDIAQYERVRNIVRLR
jgi:son of sevenless-like protein